MYPIDLRDVERAKAVVYGKGHLSARDAIHLAVMELEAGGDASYRALGLLSISTCGSGRQVAVP